MHRQTGRESCTVTQQTDHNENGWNWSFQPVLWLSSSTADESHRADWKLHFRRDLSALAMSTDLNQVGVALFPYFNIFFIIKQELSHLIPAHTWYLCQESCGLYIKFGCSIWVWVHLLRKSLSCTVNNKSWFELCHCFTDSILMSQVQLMQSFPCPETISLINIKGKPGKVKW